MKLRKLSLIIVTLIIVMASCTPDDDSVTVTPPRDRTEVYAEDLEEIETFLETHFYNYVDFDFSDPYSEANDDFEIVFTPISPDNLDKTPLIDRPELKFKMVEDSAEEGLLYKMYYLEVRQGQGEDVHAIDMVKVKYEGFTTTGTVFDNNATDTQFELTNVLNGGVVTGFREGLIEFKTATRYSDNGEGTETYHNHGIGALFIPSGIGYFNQPLEDVASYTPLIFKFSLFDRALLDHDNDGIPSFLEDLDMDLDVFNDDTNSDNAPNFFDGDDDGDGIFTSDEIELISEYFDDNDELIVFLSRAEAQNHFDNEATENQFFIGIKRNVNDIAIIEDDTFTLNTFIAPDSNNNGTPDYLDSTYPVQ